MNKIYRSIAIIVAAGSGVRTGFDIPKQYLSVKNKSILAHTTQRLCEMRHIDAVICVISPEHQSLYDASIIKHEKLLPPIYGGKTRQQSVLNGLLAIKNDNPDLVMIHDAARPNITSEFIEKLAKALENHDAVCPALQIVDSLRRSDSSIVNRDDLFMVQTPQAFHYDKILKAHEALQNENHTDDIAIAKKAGLSPIFIDGDYDNFKITYKSDLERFDKMISENTETIKKFPDIRFGNGFDVHRLIAGDGIILGGIKIPCAYALKGHSDADVLLHAITDALLGAIAAQDIGYHFSDRDPRWQGANSADFLKYAHSLIAKKGGIINHIDTVIMCEKPKISLYREAIQKSIAMLLDLDINQVSIKATTTEKLGFTGRGEGIAVQANSVVYL